MYPNKLPLKLKVTHWDLSLYGFNPNYFLQFRLRLSLTNTQPSERDPGAAMLIVKLAQEAGVPDGVLNVIHGGVDGLFTL